MSASGIMAGKRGLIMGVANANSIAWGIAQSLHAAGADILFVKAPPSEANLAEVPAMSIPVGRVRGLPIGGQFIAPRFAEADMFRAAYVLEDALGGAAHR